MLHLANVRISTADGRVAERFSLAEANMSLPSSHSFYKPGTRASGCTVLQLRALSSLDLN